MACLSVDGSSCFAQAVMHCIIISLCTKTCFSGLFIAEQDDVGCNDDDDAVLIISVTFLLCCVSDSFLKGLGVTRSVFMLK